ncbi:lamin [Culex quinquefasciatus]|uniref:Lamin n=1 Tax=Culex quinquefasciatus TaxID=7176 RepID=B0WB91_CULQU|nr:lamin [Culex quinquefasciatus]|eukprot:XP_001845975.1 lamin [Culex quinquefasciatus]
MSSGSKANANQPLKIASGAPDGPSGKASKSASKIPKLNATSNAAKDRPKSTPKLHALGKVPQYILRLRPKSSSNGEQIKMECPPSEGTDTKLQPNKEEVIETANLEGEGSSEKSILAQKKDVIDELSQYLQAARITSSKEPELTIAKLRRELAQKNAVLVENRKLNFKIEALERQLKQEGQRLIDKDQQILKLQQESLGLGDKIRELRKTTLDLAAKERLISEKDDQISKLQTAEQNLKVVNESENLDNGHSNQQNEVIIPLDVDKPEDALGEVRKRMLTIIQTCKETFKERCDEFSRLDGAGDAEQQRFDAIFETLANKQRQCCQQEDEIRSLSRKSQRCWAQRTELLGVLKKLMEENEQLSSATMRCSKESKVFKILKESTSTEGNCDVFEDAISDVEKS